MNPTCTRPPARATCAYCGDRPAKSQGPNRPKYFRGRPACVECRTAFETGVWPLPARPLPGGNRSRNGRSDRQRFPAEPDCDWDDIVRTVEDSRDV